MNLYAESSAVLSWLLGEPDGVRVLDCLVVADTVAASELTLVECDRVLIRAVLTKALSWQRIGVPKLYGALLARVRCRSRSSLLRAPAVS